MFTLITNNNTNNASAINSNINSVNNYAKKQVAPEVFKVII